MSPVKKRKVWKAIKESKIPIILGLLTAFEASVDLACSSTPFLLLNTLRIGVFYEMSKDGFLRGISNVREEQIEEQYNEVADEILKLQQIICSVADYQERQDEEKFKKEMDEKFDKSYSYSVANKVQKEDTPPWWWPFK
mmetsp:Transcript_16500/g.28021  ORF Transcript_16500/g.28021 Transcript_16500/m.28021 type:complete len:139 (+) Transcript_16500:948-1364(+)